MNTVHGAVSLSPHEAIARDLIAERVAAHHAHHQGPRQTRRYIRAALVLRRLAERLDPPAERTRAGRGLSATSGRVAIDEPYAALPPSGSPRPWAPAKRTAHRHT